MPTMQPGYVKPNKSVTNEVLGGAYAGVRHGENQIPAAVVQGELPGAADPGKRHSSAGVSGLKETSVSCRPVAVVR